MRKRVLSHGVLLTLFALLVLGLVGTGIVGNFWPRQVHAVGQSSLSLNQAFDEASQRFHVPVALLKTICYTEGRMSNQNGAPSIDHGYSCMHLTQNKRSDTLDRATKELGVSTDQIRLDMPTAILAGADILHDYAADLSLSSPASTSLANWYGVLAKYSQAPNRSVARMYADHIFHVLNTGFTAQADTKSKETVTLAPLNVKPNTATMTNAAVASATLPSGCTNDGNVDYPGAVDCIVPTSFDCTPLPDNAPCTYVLANRPTDLNISHVGIHDIEGTAQDALNVFQDINSGVSDHYIVDSDGTVYQLLHEKDVAFHIGNRWYNNHSIGIEHAGFDATGFQWYNATEYLASAKLTAYLLGKYHIPLDHDHIVSHGTVPAPTLATTPNHVDPGPYWLWDYYLFLIHQQGVPFSTPRLLKKTITLHPKTDLFPLGGNGTETPANFNFFYLYKGPSTASGLLPANGADVTDERNNVEPDVTYSYQKKVVDPAGTGDTLYEIWYGEEDPTTTPAHFTHAQLVWLAVPPGTAIEGLTTRTSTRVTLTSTDGSALSVYGRPTTSDTYRIGDAPNGSVFVSAYTVTEDGTSNQWYEINYNHRQAWVPASEVTATRS